MLQLIEVQVEKRLHTATVRDLYSTEIGNEAD